MSTVVELFGLPGAGKTTLARALAEAVGDGTVTYRSNHDVSGPARLAAAAGAGSRTPGTAIRIAAAIARSRQRSLDQVARRVLGWNATQAALVDASTDESTAGAHVLDEGVLQCLWSIGLVGDLDPVLALLSASDWARPDRVVVLEVPVDVLLARLDRRTTRHGRLDRVDPQRRAEYLARGHSTMQRLLAWWGAQAPDVVVLTTTSATPLTRRRAHHLLGLAAPPSPVLRQSSSSRSPS